MFRCNIFLDKEVWHSRLPLKNRPGSTGPRIYATIRPRRLVCKNSAYSCTTGSIKRGEGGNKEVALLPHAAERDNGTDESTTRALPAGDNHIYVATWSFVFIATVGRRLLCYVLFLFLQFGPINLLLRSVVRLGRLFWSVQSCGKFTRSRHQLCLRHHTSW